MNDGYSHGFVRHDPVIVHIKHSDMTHVLQGITNFCLPPNTSYPTTPQPQSITTHCVVLIVRTHEGMARLNCAVVRWYRSHKTCDTALSSSIGLYCNDNYLRSIYNRPNSSSNYSLFSRILQIIIRYSSNYVV